MNVKFFVYLPHPICIEEDEDDEDEQNDINEKKTVDPIHGGNLDIDDQDGIETVPSALQAAMEVRMKIQHQKEQHETGDNSPNGREETKVQFLSTS